jgi:hypothetical protein
MLVPMAAKAEIPAPPPSNKKFLREEEVEEEEDDDDDNDEANTLTFLSLRIDCACGGMIPLGKESASVNCRLLQEGYISAPFV